MDKKENCESKEGRILLFESIHISGNANIINPWKPLPLAFQTLAGFLSDRWFVFLHKITWEQRNQASSNAYCRSMLMELDFSLQLTKN